MIQIFLEGLMLGLSTGIYCVGTCFIFFVPYLLAEGKQGIFENSGKIAAFMSGRLIAYIVFALIIGFIGASYQNIFTAKFSHICLVAAALLMLVYSVTRNIKGEGFCSTLVGRFSLMRLPFFLGLFTGFNPCPPFLVGAARLLTLGNIPGCVVFFIAFFAGTSVYMLPLLSVSFFNKSERIKQIGGMIALLSGLGFYL